jgi:hypothetical protein
MIQDGVYGVGTFDVASTKARENTSYLSLRTRVDSRGEQGGAARLFNTTVEQRGIQLPVGGRGIRSNIQKYS